MKNQVTQAILVSLIATLSFSVSAQVVRPRVTPTTPVIELKPPTPGVQGLQTGQGMSLDAFKAGQGANPATPVINQGALATLNAEDQALAPAACNSSYIANEFSKKSPDLRGSEAEIARAIDSRILRPGAGCGTAQPDGSLLSVENPIVIRNVALTAACVVRGGGAGLGSSLDEVGGGCLADVKNRFLQPGEQPTDAATEVANYQAVGKCWFGTEANMTVQ